MHNIFIFDWYFTNKHKQMVHKINEGMPVLAF